MDRAIEVSSRDAAVAKRDAGTASRVPPATQPWQGFGMIEGSAALTPRVIDGLYTEAMLLADEARGYFEGLGRDERDALPVDVRVLFACESLRVTTRLMHIVSWLLTRRAIDAGEIEEMQAASPKRRLGPVEMSEPATVALLPEAARALVSSTCDLHRRIARLEEGLLARTLIEGPARDLFARLERVF